MKLQILLFAGDTTISQPPIYVGLIILSLLVFMYIFRRKIWKDSKNKWEKSVESETKEVKTEPKEKTADDYTKEEAIEYLENAFINQKNTSFARSLDALFMKLDTNEQRRWMTRLLEKIKNALVNNLRDRNDILLSEPFLHLKAIQNSLYRDESNEDFQYYLLPSLFEDPEMISAYDEYVDRKFVRSGISPLEILESMKSELKMFETRRGGSALSTENAEWQKKLTRFCYELIHSRIDAWHKEGKQFLVFENLEPDEVFDQKVSTLLEDSNILKSRKILFERKAVSELEDFFHALKKK